jgi:hypothetical protein
MTAGWLLTRTRAIPAEAATAVHIVKGGGGHGGLQGNVAVDHVVQLDRYHAVRGMRQDGPGHDLDGVFATGQLQGGRAGGLGGLNLEATRSAAEPFAVDRDAVHGDPVVRGLIALGVDVLAQRPADTLRQGQRFDGKTGQPRVDRLFGQPRSDERTSLHGSFGKRAAVGCSARISIRYFAAAFAL